MAAFSLPHHGVGLAAPASCRSPGGAGRRRCGRGREPRRWVLPAPHIATRTGRSLNSSCSSASVRSSMTVIDHDYSTSGNQGSSRFRIEIRINFSSFEPEQQSDRRRERRFRNPTETVAAHAALVRGAGLQGDKQSDEVYQIAGEVVPKQRVVGRCGRGSFGALLQGFQRHPVVPGVDTSRWSGVREPRYSKAMAIFVSPASSVSRKPAFSSAARNACRP